ncbi:MAG TPA: hypothetical protein VK939_04445 [Longimicrobiales bacterium]|nr:hypothetical protein [Longimicrobiales bacterium]
MFELIGLAMTVGATGAGYVGARRFVKERLRFVDEVQKPAAPLVAGAVAAAAAVPVVALVPLIGIPTALLFGAAVGVGTRSGVREIRRWLGGG